MKSGTYITLIFIVGAMLIGYLFAVEPAAAPAQIPAILAVVGGLSAVLAKLGETDGKVETAVAKVETSIAVSKENAASVAVLASQTGQGLEGVNQKVDGHLTALTTKIDDLMRKVATLEKDKAIKEVADAHAETSTDKIIAAMQTAVSDAAALVPPVEPTGTTPPRGTPVQT